MPMGEARGRSLSKMSFGSKSVNKSKKVPAKEENQKWVDRTRTHFPESWIWLNAVVG